MTPQNGAINNGNNGTLIPQLGSSNNSSMTPQNGAINNGNMAPQNGASSNGNMAPQKGSNSNGNNGYGQVRVDEEPQNRISDKMAGNLCIFYLVVMLAFLAWQLFDTWIGRYSLIRSVGYELKHSPTLRLIAFTLIAGALGGVVNALRSTQRYQRKGFDRRHAWKYLCAPWMGATLALFVYALLRSSISVLGGNDAGKIGATQVLSNFSVGTLVGYGSKDVFVWLDAKVEKFFHVDPSDEGNNRRAVVTSSPRNGRRPQVNQSSQRESETAQPGGIMNQAETVTMAGKAN